MKKLILAAVCLCGCLCAIPYAEAKETTVIQERIAHLYSDEVGNTVRLTGKREQGSPFVREIRIEVYEGKNLKYTIIPSVAQGYHPTVQLYRFHGKFPQIFYTADSGGSGGYGYSYVYSANRNGYDTWYDFEKDSARTDYSAKFVNGFKMKIAESGKKPLTVDVSYMDRDFLNKVFDAEGRATDTEIDVHAVGNVFAFYNASADVYQLMTYRSVSSVAEVYRLGYLARYLAFDGTTFAPYYQTFNVSF